MNNTGLVSLEGFPKLPKLKLDADFNGFSNELHLSGCPDLNYLYLCNNKIDKIETVSLVCNFICECHSPDHMIDDTVNFPSILSTTTLSSKPLCTPCKTVCLINYQSICSFYLTAPNGPSDHETAKDWCLQTGLWTTRRFQLQVLVQAIHPASKGNEELPSSLCDQDQRRFRSGERNLPWVALNSVPFDAFVAALMPLFCLTFVAGL